MASYSVIHLISISISIIWTFAKQSPNIFIIVADDLGYDDLGYQSQCHQISTPNIDYLYQTGRELEWYYAQTFCSPSRTSLMTGRYPLHSSINQVNLISYGVPLYFDFLPKILKQESAYKTHAFGKWHMGYYQVEYTPTYRGFDSFYGFYSGCDNYVNHTGFTGFVNGVPTYNVFDFRNDTQPNCGYNCSLVAYQNDNIYSTFLYTKSIQNTIINHNNTQPLFMYLPFQNVHYPCQCPQEYIDKYNTTISNTTRREFAGQLSILDEAIGNITYTLKQYKYLDNNTIIIFTSDNGAPVHSAGCGGSNYPLRGEKGSIWEGGTRVTAAFWATDDILGTMKDGIRGTKYTQLMHIVDWYSTLIFGAVGIDVDKVNITNLDSINHWDTLIRKNDDNIYFGVRDSIYYGYDAPLKNIGYRKQWLKIFNGTGGEKQFSGWYPPPIGIKINYNVEDIQYMEKYPNHIPLYNLSNDPYEYYDINNSTEMNNIAMELWNEMVELQKTGIPNARNDPNCLNVSYPYDPNVNMTVLAPFCNRTV